MLPCCRRCGQIGCRALTIDAPIITAAGVTTGQQQQRGQGAADAAGARPQVRPATRVWHSGAGCTQPRCLRACVPAPGAVICHGPPQPVNAQLFEATKIPWPAPPMVWALRSHWHRFWRCFFRAHWHTFMRCAFFFGTRCAPFPGIPCREADAAKAEKERLRRALIDAEIELQVGQAAGVCAVVHVSAPPVASAM